MNKVNKRSAASRKGWRTRKKIARARAKEEIVIGGQAYLLPLDKQLAKEFVEYIRPEMFIGRIENPKARKLVIKRVRQARIATAQAR
jgi:hypothetical protein